MTISSRARRVMAIAATGFTLGLGAFAAVPAQAATAPAQTAASAHSGTSARLHAVAPAASLSLPSATFQFSGSYNINYYTSLIPITSTVDAFGLIEGTTLFQTGQVLVSFSNGISDRIIMQTDGNFVDYVSNGKIWGAGTNGRGGYKVAFQGDGNLVVRNASGQALWASNTHTYPNAFLAMQSDGNLVIYVSTTDLHPLWASHTNS